MDSFNISILNNLREFGIRKQVKKLVISQIFWVHPKFGVIS